jgi:hypothetical protein
MTRTAVISVLLTVVFPLVAVSYVIPSSVVHIDSRRGNDLLLLLHSCSSDKSLSSTNDITISNNRRRKILGRVFDLGKIALFGSGTLAIGPTRADATYSAYAQREKDWIERESKGEIKVSTPKDLRRQLKDIAPMNDNSKSKIFCPNGPSALVSPLMENKCGDRLATPSVYGRTEDIVGNSIPGFNYDGGAAEFPKYNAK